MTNLTELAEMYKFHGVKVTPVPNSDTLEVSVKEYNYSRSYTKLGSIWNNSGLWYAECDKTKKVDGGVKNKNQAVEYVLAMHVTAVTAEREARAAAEAAPFTVEEAKKFLCEYLRPVIISSEKILEEFKNDVAGAASITYFLEWKSYAVARAEMESKLATDVLAWLETAHPSKWAAGLRHWYTSDREYVTDSSQWNNYSTSPIANVLRTEQCAAKVSFWKHFDYHIARLERKGILLED